MKTQTGIGSGKVVYSSIQTTAENSLGRGIYRRVRSFVRDTGNGDQESSVADSRQRAVMTMTLSEDDLEPRGPEELGATYDGSVVPCKHSTVRR